MKKCLMGLILAGLFPALAASSGPSPLKLVRTLPLVGVHGNFDHLAVDLAGHRLFVAAEHQPAVEVLDLRTGKRLAEIRGFKKPHAIFFFPRRNELFVTDGGDGTVKVFQANTYRLLQTIKLQIDADSGYYDPASGRLFVVNGGSNAGESYSFVSVIDTRTHSVAKNIKVPDNGPEAVRLGENNRLYINLNGDNQVGVLDVVSGKLVARWGLDGATDNVPMDIDRMDHRLFVVTRSPAKLFVLDTQTGKVVASLNCAGDADDMVYDAAHKLILVSCGAGVICVYRQTDPDHYSLAAKVPSGPRGKTSLWVPSLHRYYVAVPARGGKSARILVYQGL
ncbi:MAG: YncE family protein [Terriglobia bacterium]